jgi:hypothetical protein
MKHHSIAASVAALIWPACGVQAEPANTCLSYQDQIVQPITIDAALARFKNATLTKDEFETSAQFEARQRAALGDHISPQIISKEVDPQYIQYNADTQDFVVQTYLFDNANISYSVLGYPGPIKTGLMSNVDVVISETETPAGSYEASNAYGAKATVVKVDRVTKGIWDHLPLRSPAAYSIRDGLTERCSRRLYRLKRRVSSSRSSRSPFSLRRKRLIS